MSQRRGVATQEGLETIAQRLVRIRKQKGITQQNMAQWLGISQPVCSDYERGVLRLHGELIIKMAERLQVSADELLGLEPPQRTTTLKNQRLRKRLEQIERLPQRDKEALLRTIDAFLAKHPHTAEPQPPEPRPSVP
jgi:transcriptional regulator with XRE-family HTH domain